MMPFQHTDGRGHTVTITTPPEHVKLALCGWHNGKWTEVTATLTQEAIEALHVGLSGRETSIGVVSSEGHAVRVSLDRLSRKATIQINEGPDVEFGFGALTILGLKLAALKARRR